GAAGRFRRRRRVVAGDRTPPRRPCARAGDRPAAEAGWLVLRVERDPRSPCFLDVQGETAGARALAARPDAYAGIRVGGTLPFGARARRARVRRPALVAAEGAAHRSRLPRRGSCPSDQTRAPARAVPGASELGLACAPGDRNTDPRLPLGRSNRTETG